MIKFYVEKIMSGAINSNTGAAWVVEDVPKLWRAKVQKEMEG